MLDVHFHINKNPLEGTGGSIDARNNILKENRATLLGLWHKLMMQLIDEVLTSG